MPRNLPDTIVKQIFLHAELLKHPDGRPNQSAIAKKLGLGVTTVHQRLKKIPARKEDLPKEEVVEKLKEQLWDDVQNEVAESLMTSHKTLVDRWKECLENNFDARDVRHMAQALDVNVKTISLMTGGVTSRTQQNQTVDHTVKHEVIQVPAKESAAFLTEQGVKGELPAAYDVDKDE